MKTALLILDIQQDFTGPDARMPVNSAQADSMICHINELVDARAANGLDPVYIVNEFPRNNIANFFRRFAAIKGSAGAAFDPRLHIAGDTVFAKHRPNAFTNPLLHLYLQRQGVDSLLITGLFAGACVRATINGAIRLGYRVSVIPHCIASRSDASRNRALRHFRKAGAEVVWQTWFADP
jgi:nicotinamidase-related amidase